MRKMTEADVAFESMGRRDGRRAAHGIPPEPIGDPGARRKAIYREAFEDAMGYERKIMSRVAAKKKAGERHQAEADYRSRARKERGMKWGQRKKQTQPQPAVKLPPVRPDETDPEQPHPSVAGKTIEDVWCGDCDCPASECDTNRCPTPAAWFLRDDAAA